MGWTILLKPKFWLIAVILALGVSSVVMAFRVKILTLERDAAVDARVVAEGQLEAARRESILKTAALENVRKADNDRNQFQRSAEKIIHESRVRGGDAPVPSVLRDVAGSVRGRYQAYRANQNP